MLALLRHTRCSAARFTRSFAEVVPVSTSQNSKSIPPTTSISPLHPTNAGAVSTEPSSPQSVAPIRLGNRVPVKEDHGLYGFFRKKVSEKAGEVFEGEAQYETLGGSIYGERAQSGRSWKASELRLKSFRDLHTLWYILLRERNLLATQEEEVRRLGVLKLMTSFSYKKRQCRKSMARIKAVINERRLAYEGALRIAEEKKQEHLDHIVLQHQKAGFNKDRAYLARRRAYMEQKLAKKRAAREAMAAAAAATTAEDSVPVEDIEKVEIVETVAEEKDATPLLESVVPEETVKVEVVETVTEVKPAPEDALAKKTASPQPRVKATPEVTQADRPTKGESASEAATAGLFGNSAGGRRSR